MPTNIRDVTFDSIRFGAARDNVGGGRTVSIYDPTNSKCTIQINNCSTVHGFQGKRIELKIPYAHVLRSLDDRVVAQAKQECQGWFGKPNIQAGVIDDMYKSSCMNDILSVRVPLDPISNKFSGSVFNIKPERIDPTNNVLVNVRLDAIVQLTGVYFIPGAFGLSWKLIQLLVHPTYSLSSCSFQADADDESDAEPV
jgi:hypothetical protein